MSILLGITLVFASSCENELTNVSPALNPAAAEFSQKSLDVPSGPGETILGNELENPYALENVQTAYSMLKTEGSKLEPTHYYLKFIPEDGIQVSALEDYAEENDYEFEIQPVHYEVIYEGDDQNDVFPAPLQLSEIKELARLTTINMDRVDGLTFEEQLNTLNPFIGTIDNFKLSLKAHAISQGVNEADYEELFRAYGH